MATGRRKNAHCSYCGSVFGADQLWPRTCGGCTNTSYLNPLPVGVMLLPVDGGLLCVRRDIEPARGELALPGGFLDVGETWQEGCARELREETGVSIDPQEIRLFQTLSDPHGFLLVFGLARARTLAELPPLGAGHETSECVVLNEPVPLAFPLHTLVMRDYFADRGAR
jgi:ADP-ribose pyrophosphatase YjhB (NUDIX family)